MDIDFQRTLLTSNSFRIQNQLNPLDESLANYDRTVISPSETHFGLTFIGISIAIKYIMDLSLEKMQDSKVAIASQLLSCDDLIKYAKGLACEVF